MTDARWDKIGALFEQARALPPEEQDAFLEAQCDDEAVRQEVASLLATYEEASGFFEGFADAAFAQALDDLLPAEEQHTAGSDPLALEGTRVARYAVEEHLGGGGMGVVYRAHDTRLGRTVALKFLPPHLAASAKAEERFVREARSAATLDHPNIATIHEIGETEEGRRFIAMACYEGETLKKKIERGPLPVDKAIGYATQIAEGLGRAHEAGIMHRDVKPANVMVTERGTVKLLDFGLARAADQSRLTRSGTRMGTVAYMSPEQAEGSEAVDHRTDLWALGVMLYEMLTGERPFRGEREVAVVHAILHEEPTPIGALRDDASPELQALVERCLQKDPERRYASAEALLDDLRALRGASSSATSAVEQSQWSSRSPVRLRRRSLWGGAVVLLILIAALGWMLWPASDGAPDLAKHSIAVLPFEVSGSGAETWRDGMVTVLSAGLDGAAGLRAIPDRTVFATWERLDTTRAAARSNQALTTARHVGAEYAVVGSAVALGEELRLVANVRETDSGRRLGQAQVRGAPDNVMALADELTRQVLGVLLEQSEEAIPSVDLASLTTESLPALKSYLAGERHYRAGEYEAAIEDYQTATEQDSTFALAYARLGHSRAWIGRAGGGLQALRQAYALSHRLPLRERQIVWSLYARYIQGRDLAVADSLRQLTDVYPDDPQIWYFLGETLFHGNIPGGWPEAEKAFEQATKLDPGVAPYHYHLMDIALSFHHDAALAARRIDAHPKGRIKDIHQVFWNLIFGSSERQQRAWTRLDTLSLSDTRDPYWIVWPLMHPTDRKLQAQVIETFQERDNIEPGRLTRQLLLRNRLDRGQIQEAASLLQKLPMEPGCYWSASLSLGYPIPDSLLRSHLEPSQIEDGASLGRLACAGLYLIERGREDKLPAMLRRIREARPEQDVSEYQPQRVIDALKGYRAWKAGSLKQAATLWSNKYSFGGLFGAIWRGDLYRELGQLQKAEDWYVAAWTHPVAHERLGQLYEEMGKPEKAAAAYERFIAAWADVDEPLQDRVRAARERLQQLSTATP